MDEALAFADAAEGEERGEERRKGWLWRKPRKPRALHALIPLSIHKIRVSLDFGLEWKSCSHQSQNIEATWQPLFPSRWPWPSLQNLRHSLPPSGRHARVF